MRFAQGHTAGERQGWGLPSARVCAYMHTEQCGSVPTPRLPWLGTGCDGICLVDAGREIRVEQLQLSPGPWDLGQAGWQGSLALFVPGEPGGHLRLS